MSESRRSKVLGEVADIKQGRYLAKEDMAAERSAKFPVPVYGANGIIGWTDRAMYPAGVPLVTCRGSNSGMVLWADGPLWVSNNAMAIIPFDGDLRFAYYCLLNSPPYETVSGSAQPQITRTALAPKRVLWPAEDVQRAISGALTALDDKIELNRRMNETLEAMAQAIFRDWFVDFGPVRRKLEGATDPVAIMGGLTTDPARAVELAGLFPDAADDGDLPVGWKLARVEDVMELAYGKSLPKAERAAGNVPVYGSGGIGGFNDTALNAGPGIIVGRKGTVGSLFWEPGPFFAIDTVFYVVPKAGVSLNFAWQLLQTLGLSDMNTDAAVPGLNRSNVYRLEMPLAPAPVRRAFDGVAGSLRALLDARSAESRTLAETRDYLLPRLMSGEVRIAEAAVRVGETA